MKRTPTRRRKPAPTAPAAPASRHPRFEAMAVTVEAAPAQDPRDVVKRVAAKAGLGRWRIEPVAIAAPRAEYELRPPRRGRTPTPGAAWDATYRLRDQPGVVHAEPLFQYEVPDLYRLVTRRAAGGGGHHPDTNHNYEWSLARARVIQAWPLFGAREPGASVVVGHPDTGYTRHPELADATRLLASQGHDYDDDDPDATDDLESGFLDHPGHGTGTGSVIVSNRGLAPGNDGPAFVSGVAPHASLIPIRVTESVVLLSMRALRHAIDHAVTRGAHVVSISLGGPLPSDSLRAALRRAVDAGTIVLAAAGNYVGVVVYPALFDDVIACAASTIEDEPWWGSCRGDAVDITAPGASVWRAEVDRAGASPYAVTRGSGTSFAVATTAGVAALWISYHGWANLVRRYGTAGVPRVFKSLLQSTCRAPAGWDTANFGPGIVDARALLAAPLPDQVPARKLRDARRAAVTADATGLEAIVHLLPGASRTGVERALAALLRVPDRELPRVLQDVGDELAFQLVMHPPLREELHRRAKRPAAARAAPARTLALDRRDTSRRLRARVAGRPR